MPQPVKDLHKFEPVWTANLILQRPMIAAHIGTIAAMWTEVETNIGHILSAICGVSSETATTIYVALASTGARIDALKAISKNRITRAQQENLVILLKQFRARSSERNDIVHGMWGISKTDEKCLLHQHPGAHTTMVASILFGPWRRKPPFSPIRGGKNKSPTLRYSEADFLATERRIAKLKDDAWAFCMEIHHRRRRRLARAAPKEVIPPHLP